MYTKVCFFHTVASLARRFDDLAAEYVPDVDHFHIVDESVLNDALEAGELTPAVNRRICSQLSLAEDAGADLILDTCSSTSPAVDVAREMVGVPILKIDDPMTEAAVEHGEDITILATAESTLGPSAELVQRKADQRAKEINLRTELVDDALNALQSGEKNRHDQLVIDHAVELAGPTDVIVLAQASMSHLAPDLSDRVSAPVFSSPDMAMETVAEEVRNSS
ncbi:aspartate/glutamate racemase family protein [Haladaptatus halobius]|uniref:aspartate/glutamate racemase family protein n=1 Tax=Haladaptatus halobius TaxID=2884875 RepID=UPI001D0BA548|nr:aspartate/glutamate racemase family protein [Haladaptatus halobius]